MGAIVVRSFVEPSDRRATIFYTPDGRYEVQFISEFSKQSGRLTAKDLDHAIKLAQDFAERRRTFYVDAELGLQPISLR